MTTEQKNKVIAIFDSWKIERGMEEHENPLMYKGFNCFFLKDALFHKDWLWLMPVVEKINTMKDDTKKMFMGTTLERYVEFTKVTDLSISTPIAATHEAVFQFCQWYLNQKN